MTAVYLTANTGLTVDPVKPTANLLTADNLQQRVEKFNKNEHGLHMSVVSICYNFMSLITVVF